MPADPKYPRRKATRAAVASGELVIDDESVGDNGINQASAGDFGDGYDDRAIGVTQTPPQEIETVENASQEIDDDETGLRDTDDVNYRCGDCGFVLQLSDSHCEGCDSLLDWRGIK